MIIYHIRLEILLLYPFFLAVGKQLFHFITAHAESVKFRV